MSSDAPSVFEDFEFPRNDDLDFTMRPLSPSSISLHSQCPRRWKFRYVDQIPEPPGAPAVLGTFVHLVLEHLMNLPNGKRTQEAARRLAGELWVSDVETAEDFQSFGYDNDEILKFKQTSWQKIKGLWDLEDPNEVEVVATETFIETLVQGVPFRGIIDRLDRTKKGLEVVDLKSGKAPLPRYEDDKTAQLFLYAVALEARDGEAPASIRLLYLGDRAIQKKVTPNRLGEQRVKLRVTWSSIENSLASDTWEPAVGPLCAWCPYVGLCPEGEREVRQRHARGRVREDAPGLALLGIS